MTPIGNCPWCGGEAKAFNLMPEHHPGPASWYVECRKCYAAGPCTDTEDLTNAAWNKLAGPDVVVGKMRWVDRTMGPGGLFKMNDLVIGYTHRLTTGWWMANFSAGMSAGTHETDEAARAALAAAVKRAMGGGG